MTPECPNASNSETFQGFLHHQKRMTDRCAFFICVLALETSCEAAAIICKSMGIQVSGDTIIRMLLARAEEMSAEAAGDFIGVDDFAYKKGQTYCTVLVNGESHGIIDILEGRDADKLKRGSKRTSKSAALPGIVPVATRKPLPKSCRMLCRFRTGSTCIRTCWIASNPSSTTSCHLGSRSLRKRQNRTLPCARKRNRKKPIGVQPKAI